ncbi:CTR2 [Sanghuangporus sanghuang]
MNHFDHSGHEGMDHGMPDTDHDGHGGMDMGGKCSMNMLWNTQIIDTCIVFPQWHIRSHASFVLSFFAIVALGIFYEWLRFFARRVDRSVARSILTNSNGKNKGRPGVSTSGALRRSPSPASASPDEDAGLLTGSSVSRARKGVQFARVSPPARALRAVLYGAQVFLSFFLMLIFMTYNAYLILAVVLGAAIGHYYLGGQMDVDGILSGTSDDKGMACH